MNAVLAFDCAVSSLGVAILRDGACVVQVREEGRDQAARLLPAIAAALDEAEVDRGEIDLIAVTNGPGSFTGVRVGLAAARGLSVGLGVPLAGLTTTAVLLGQAPTTERVVVACVDSRLGDWFCAIAEGERNPFVASAADLARRLAGRPCFVIGHGIAELVSSLAAAGIDVLACDALPDVAVLGRLALAAGIESWSDHNRNEGLPRPLYLRGVSITLPDGSRRTVD